MIANAPPGRIVASLIKNADTLPTDLFSFADTVMFAAVVLANDRPINVAVEPLETVSVTVDGLADKPRFGVAFDLNAIYYPNAIAIAIAVDMVSLVLFTSKLVLALAAFVRSLRLDDFSILSALRLMKLLSNSVLLKGLPLAAAPVCRVTIVDILSSY